MRGRRLEDLRDLAFGTLGSAVPEQLGPIEDDSETDLGRGQVVLPKDCERPAEATPALAQHFVVVGVVRALVVVPSNVVLLRADGAEQGVLLLVRKFDASRRAGTVVPPRSLQASIHMNELLRRHELVEVHIPRRVAGLLVVHDARTLQFFVPVVNVPPNLMLYGLRSCVLSDGWVEEHRSDERKQRRANTKASMRATESTSNMRAGQELISAVGLTKQTRRQNCREGHDIAAGQRPHSLGRASVGIKESDGFEVTDGGV